MKTTKRITDGDQLNVPRDTGIRYEDNVPDTLDLVERAELGLRHFTEIIHEDYDFEMPLTCYFDEKQPHRSGPVMLMHGNSLGGCQPKAVEAMCFLRLMTGSDVNIEREAAMIRMVVSQFGEDGLHWVPGSPDKPWLNIPEPFAMVHGQGRILRAMVAWYQYNGSAFWKERIDGLVDGIDRHLVVHKDGYAYVPVRGYYDEDYLRSCYTARGWKDTQEPIDEKYGEEGSLFNHQGHLPGAMATWYVLTGNEQALRLAGELITFYTQPQFWADWEKGDYPGVIGAEHAHWHGHLHGHVNVLRAILDYSVAVDDARLKSFVRDGYEWARQGVFARIGYVGDGQGCGCGRLIGLAVKLSYAGIGDYWEDVDQYIRNQGTEMQLVPEDVPYLQGLHKGKSGHVAKPGETTDRVVERCIGGFSGIIDKSCAWLCCSPHGNMGLYYAWDSIVRYENDTARIHLLLNRASPWLDIHSYLPYEGRVVVKNKTARKVSVRIPLWVGHGNVRCRVNGQDRANVWFGNYLCFEDLRSKDEIVIQFPVEDRIEEWTVPRVRFPGPETQTHTCRFRGNTLIEITPGLEGGSPLYQQRPEKYRAASASLKKVTRYVAPLLLRW